MKGSPTKVGLSLYHYPPSRAALLASRHGTTVLRSRNLQPFGTSRVAPCAHRAPLQPTVLPCAFCAATRGNAHLCGFPASSRLAHQGSHRARTVRPLTHKCGWRPSTVGFTVFLSPFYPLRIVPRVVARRNRMASGLLRLGSPFFFHRSTRCALCHESWQDATEWLAAFYGWVHRFSFTVLPVAHCATSRGKTQQNG